MGNNKAEKLRDLVPIPVPKEAKEGDAQSIAKLNLIKRKRNEVGETGVNELIQDYLDGDNPNLSERFAEKDPKKIKAIDRECLAFLEDEKIS